MTLAGVLLLGPLVMPPKRHDLGPHAPLLFLLLAAVVGACATPAPPCPRSKNNSCVR